MLRSMVLAMVPWRWPSWHTNVVEERRIHWCKNNQFKWVTQSYRLHIKMTDVSALKNKVILSAISWRNLRLPRYNNLWFQSFTLYVLLLMYSHTHIDSHTHMHNSFSVTFGEQYNKKYFEVYELQMFWYLLRILRCIFI